MGSEKKIRIVHVNANMSKQAHDIIVVGTRRKNIDVALVSETNKQIFSSQTVRKKDIRNKAAIKTNSDKFLTVEWEACDGLV